jgi:Holliday junction resolvase RusA-like endonuclease
MITIDMPRPIGTNSLRKIDWSSAPARRKWKKAADALFLWQKRKLGKPITTPYEIRIVVQYGCKLDLDNCAKLLIDTLVGWKVVPDDRYLRRLVIEHGEAPEGSRVTIEAV